MPTALEERLTRLCGEVDGWLRSYFEAREGPAESFYQMLGYHLGWLDRDGSIVTGPAAGGKRLRSMLSILTCEALGGKADSARGPAIAVELVHNFSLVHDDIQDESRYRRGRETVWHLWGAPQAINVGDAMFALAQVALVDGMERRTPVADAIRCLNEACLRLVEGQFMDLRLESSSSVSLELYEQMIARKTAALIECACVLGALAAEATQATVSACARYGHELGMAFQFQDDLLGVWGDPSVTGKPGDADLRSRKKSLPLVLGLDMASGAVEDRLRELLAQPAPLGDAEAASVLQILEQLQVKERGQTMVDERFAAVEVALRSTLPRGREHELLELCDRLRTRVN